MAPEKPRKEQEEELMLEDGGIEESPRRSFEDCGDSEEDRGEGDDEEERDSDRDGVGSTRSFLPQKWPQSYRCVRCSHSLLGRRLRTRPFFYCSVYYGGINYYQRSVLFTTSIYFIISTYLLPVDCFFRILPVDCCL
jgi:hypothetical protein